MTTHLFPPISDKAHFPILASRCEHPHSTLMECDGLTFFALNNLAITSSLARRMGRDWHQYGDTRWPSTSAWVESPLSFAGDSANCGVLVMIAQAPAQERDLFAWFAHNNPLLSILPQERSEAVIRERIQMMRTQAASSENIPGPQNSQPTSIQSYCIFVHDRDREPRFVATYTDLLNADGIPISLYRMASARSSDVFVCRQALHVLFSLNETRLAGTEFIEASQIPEFGPARLSADAKTPKWAQFHPSRVLRTRPILRATPTPTNMTGGILELKDYERIVEIVRREASANMLAFDRLSRPRDMAIYNNDANSSLTAFIHRANGGAIYVLPDQLVEEFDNTDCSEVLIDDIALPFPNLYLKFTPPHPLLLTNNALVDGCYVVKQGDEFLFILTSSMDATDYQHSPSIACVDPTFSLHLPATHPGTTINAAVDRGIEDFLAMNAPPDDDLSTTVERDDGTHVTFIDGRAESRRKRIQVFRSQEPVFRQCLNIIVNAACFIAFRPEDISEGWEGEPPAELLDAVSNPGTSRSGRDKKRGALKRLEHGDFTRIRICGKLLFPNLHDYGAPGSGKSPRAHWRRGHWRRQRHGVGLSLVVLRWIRPTIVKRESGSLVEARIYDVEKPKESE